MAHTKPILLLDVDGPLNPFEARTMPAGYQKHIIQPDGWRTTLRVWLNPRHGVMLQEITRYVDLVWATAWRDEANVEIGPRIGLPELPVIPLEGGWHTLTEHIWKLNAVSAYVGDRPFAWFDDDFTKDDLDWAARRNVEVAPTLLLSIDPAIGLVRADIDKVERWGLLQQVLSTDNNEGP